jgi:RNA polymerase sigma factor (sigma-70 family)
MKGSERSGDSVASVLRVIQERTGTSSVVERAADRLLRKTEPAARTACRVYGRGLSDPRIEELVQETLLVAWTKVHHFTAEGPSFDAWVRGIAKNLCRNAKKKREDVLTEDGIVDPKDAEHSLLKGMQQDQRDALVTAAIESVLTGIEQDVVFYKYCQDLGREEIAALLGLDGADAVRVILVRARRRLRPEILRRLAELGRNDRSMIRVTSSHN